MEAGDESEVATQVCCSKVCRVFFWARDGKNGRCTRLGLQQHGPGQRQQLAMPIHKTRRAVILKLTCQTRCPRHVPHPTWQSTANSQTGWLLRNDSTPRFMQAMLCYLGPPYQVLQERSTKLRSTASPFPMTVPHVPHQGRPPCRSASSSGTQRHQRPSLLRTAETTQRAGSDRR
jgi:hypothetical protein